MQDWSEAEEAFANTPTHLRDSAWETARAELDAKRNTCTCGIAETEISFSTTPDVFVLSNQGSPVIRMTQKGEIFYNGRLIEKDKELVEAFKDFLNGFPERDALIKKQQEYIKLLVDELNEIVTTVAQHGWRSTRVEEGERLRAEIKTLEEKTFHGNKPSVLQEELADEGYVAHYNRIDEQVAISSSCALCGKFPMRYIGMKKEGVEESSGQSSASYAAICHCDNCGHEYEF
jgi:hypothetical protein